VELINCLTTARIDEVSHKFDEDAPPFTNWESSFCCALCCFRV